MMQQSTSIERHPQGCALLKKGAHNPIACFGCISGCPGMTGHTAAWVSALMIMWDVA